MIPVRRRTFVKGRESRDQTTDDGTHDGHHRAAGNNRTIGVCDRVVHQLKKQTGRIAGERMTVLINPT